MYTHKSMFKIVAIVLFSFLSSACFAETSIDNTQGCAIRDLDVTSQKGEKIKLDLIRTARDSRGEVFLKINTKDPIGEHLVLYINNSQPEVLKIIQAKGSFIPMNVIRKLRSATSLRFTVAMKKGAPLMASLNQYHFDWMKRFGKTCS